MGESYKDSLYSQYVSTHISHRKGHSGVALLKRQARGYRQHFGSFLPSIKSAKVADLGCGSGSLVWWLQQQGFENAQGVDLSSEQVAVSRELGINGVSEGDVFSFLDKNKKYDTLFARDLIEHFDKQTVFDFLKKSFVYLEVNGRLVLQVPNAESPYFGRIRYGDFTHELAFTSSSIIQLLSAVGFDRIQVHPWRPAITGIRSFLRYLVWRVIEPLLKLPILIESGGHNRIVTMNLIAVAQKPAA